MNSLFCALKKDKRLLSNLLNTNWNKLLRDKSVADCCSSITGGMIRFNFRRSTSIFDMQIQVKIDDGTLG
jgi:hypothetical protein